FVPFSATEAPIKVMCGPPDRPACARVRRAHKSRRPPDAPTHSARARLRGQGVFPQRAPKSETRRQAHALRLGALGMAARLHRGRTPRRHEGPDGSWTDVTLSMDEDPQVARLFLPDAAAVYDFDN